MRAVILGVQEVGIVGRDHRHVDLPGEPEDLLVHGVLARGVVPLDLQVIPLPEDVGVPLRRLARGLPVVLGQPPRHFPRHARGGADQPRRMALDHLAVDARLVVEALQIPDGGELDQVPVPLAVAGEQHEVVVRLLDLAPAHAHRLLVPPVAGGHVRLHADDGPDALLLRRLAEGPGPEKAPVVRKGQRRHLELLRLVDEIGETVGAVEEGELRVAVEMDERQGRLDAGVGREGCRSDAPGHRNHLNRCRRAPGAKGLPQGSLRGCRWRATLGRQAVRARRRWRDREVQPSRTTVLAIANTSSTPSACMHQKAPSQVGRLPQGAQGWSSSAMRARACGASR